jgi:hypothetical protein
MLMIQYRKEDDGTHRITVESDRVDCDALVFVFSSEGVVIDAVTGGVVESTKSMMYESIEEEME